MISYIMGLYQIIVGIFLNLNNKLLLDIENYMKSQINEIVGTALITTTSMTFQYEI